MRLTIFVGMFHGTSLQLPLYLQRLTISEGMDLVGEVFPGLKLTGLKGAAHDDIDGGLVTADACGEDLVPAAGGGELIFEGRRFCR